MAGAFTAWFNLSTRQGTFLPTMEAIKHVASVRHELLNHVEAVSPHVTHHILNPSAIVRFQQAEDCLA